MSWKIRPFNYSSTEYREVLALRNALFPGNPSSVEIWRHWDDARPPGSKFGRLVAEDASGRLIGYAQFGEMDPESGTFAFNFQIRSRYWGSDLPAALYDRVQSSLSEHAPKRLNIHVRETETDKIALLRMNGYEQAMRSPVAHLQVQEFNADEFAGVLDKVGQTGVEIRQPPEGWPRREDWQRLVYELEWALMEDVPHYQDRVRPPFDQYVREELQHPNFLPRGYFLAFEEQEAIGMTYLVKRGGKTNVLGVGITGVLRGYRRRGIATALKVESVVFARNIGAEIIVADNEEDNPMFLLNKKLGFEPESAWTDWIKDVED